MPGSDVIINIRERGARQTAGQVDVVSGALRRMGVGAKTATVASKQLKETGSTMVTPLRKLRGEAAGLAKSFIGMGLAFGSVEGIHRAIETTDNLVKSTIQLHSQFGLTTQAASGLSGVLQTRGISPMALRMGFVTLSKAMVGANQGTKRFLQDFRRIGLHARDIHKALGSSDGLSSVFETVTERLTRMQGGARKAALGQDLLGRASRGLAPLLQEGALGLRQQLKWANEFGVTLNGKTIKSVEQMAAAQTKAQYAALGLQIQMGQLLAPTLTKVNTTFSDVVKSFRDGRPEGNKYARTIYKVGQDLKPVGHDLMLVGKYLKDHPKLLRLAAFAFIGYKTKLLSLLTIGPKAYLTGLAAGREYAAGVQTGTAEGATAQRGAFASIGSRIGTWIGPAIVGAIIASEVWHNLIEGVAGQSPKAEHKGLAAAHSRMQWARLTHPGFLRSHPGAKRLEGRYFSLEDQIANYAAGAGPNMTVGQVNRLTLRDIAMRNRLRGMGDPDLVFPRSAAGQRRFIIENHITLRTPDGKVLLKQIQRAQADQRARR